MSNDLDVVAAEGLKTAHGINDKVQRAPGTLEGVRNRADDERNTVQDIGSRVIDGAPVILNQPSIPS